MLNLHLSLRYVGFILLVFSFSMLIPVGVSFLSGTDPSPFFYAFGITAAFGWLMNRAFFTKIKGEIHRRDSLLIVVLTWFGISFFGSLPFLLSHVFGPVSWEALINSVFESSSGFTTTGASVMHHIESAPYDILLWRALTQWIGGMGIILLVVAVLPFLGVGGLELYSAEAAGPTTDKIQPRVTQTAKSLWLAYVVLTVLCISALAFSGMPFFDAVCHAFATVATGGYSTRNASIGAYGSPLYEWITIVFMFLGGASFVLHYQALRGSFQYWRDQQFRTYVGILIGACGLVLFCNWIYRGVGSWHDEIRAVVFQVVSLGSTTGFGTADYEEWPFFSQFILACLLVMGACAGSTAGGIKTIRVIVIVRHAFNELFRFIHPQSVSSIKVDNQVVAGSTLNGIFGFLTFYFFTFIIAAGILSFFGADFQTATTSVLSSMAGVGPAFGDTGPTENYAFLHPVSKGTLSLCMILGRLELITFVTLCFPEYWKK